MDDIDFGLGGTRRVFFKYAFPSIVGMLIVSLQTMVDGMFLAKGVGALGLAAVNLSMPLISVMLSVAVMIISGGIVISGVAKGRNDEALCRGYTTLTFIALVATAVVMSAAVLLNLRGICYALGADDEIYPYVRTYIGIICGGFIFYCIPNFTEAFTRLRGKPGWVFISGSICFIVNVVLDYFFILKFGWGMAGAAIATCAANTTAAIVLAHNVKMGKMRGGADEIRKIYFNGSSEMFTSVSAAVTTYIFNLVLMKNIGSIGVAALTIVFYINFIVNMSLFGMSQALYPLMSFCLGAKDYRRIKELLFTAMFFSGVVGFGVYFIVLIFKRPIISVFSDGNVRLTELAITATTYVTIHYLVSFINIVAGSFHTAVERPLESVVIALCRSIVFVLIPLWVLPRFIGDNGIWLSMPVAELLTLFVSIPLMCLTMKKLKKF